jgi:hypothetical protein
MKFRRYLIFWAACVGLLCIFIWTENYAARGFQECVKQYSSDHGNEKGNKETSVVSISAQSVCSLRLIDRHNGFFAALAAFIIAWFTYTLRRSTDELRESGEKQIVISKQLADIAKAQHIAATRPRLLVRHIEINSVFSADFTIMLGHEAKISGRLTVVNAGGSKAHIVTSEHRIFAAKDGLPIRPPYDGSYPNLLAGGQSLEVGESVECAISDTLVMPFDERFGRPVRQFADEGWSLYVMGRISYMDDAGAERFMAFCRERKSDGRFTAVDDHDYEYED